MTTRSDAGPGTAHDVTVRPDGGSFRDPLSRVFVDDEVDLARIDRRRPRRLRSTGGVNVLRRRPRARRHRRHRACRRRCSRCPASGPPCFVTSGSASLSYPYEWSFEMLRDAARLQLTLTRQALAESLITKDASAYNVQFVGSKPVFIDVGSFEKLRARRAVGRLSPVLRAVPQPAVRPGASRRAISTAAARPPRRDHPWRCRRDHRQRRTLPQGRVHPRPTARPRRAQVRRRRPRARRPCRAQAGRLRAEP